MAALLSDRAISIAEHLDYKSAYKKRLGLVSFKIKAHFRYRKLPWWPRSGGINLKEL